MALAAVHTFVAGATLTAAQLNAMNLNVLNNGLSLISPLTGSLDAGEKDLTEIDELELDDAAAAATAAGRLRRNGAVLEWASANNGGLKVGAVSGTPVANALYQEGVVKGWAVITQSSPGSLAFTLVDSYNVASITTGTLPLTITWDRDFASAHYAIGVSALSTTTPTPGQVTGQTVGTCIVTVGDIFGGAGVGGVEESGWSTLYVIACGDQ